MPKRTKLRLGRFTSERGCKLRARVDRELPVDARKVDLHRPRSDEERLRDLSVRVLCGCHLGDAALAGSEGVHAAESDAPRARAGGEELAFGACGERGGAADRRKLDRVPKLLAGVGAAVRSA